MRIFDAISQDSYLPKADRPLFDALLGIQTALSVLGIVACIVSPSQKSPIFSGGIVLSLGMYFVFTIKCRRWYSIVRATPGGCPQDWRRLVWSTVQVATFVIVSKFDLLFRCYFVALIVLGCTYCWYIAIKIWPTSKFPPYLEHD